MPNMNRVLDFGAMNLCSHRGRDYLVDRVPQERVT